jgi:hypothetical protein
MKAPPWLLLALGAVFVLRALKPKPPPDGRVVWWHTGDGQFYAEPGMTGLGFWRTIPDGTPFYNFAAPW